MISKCIRRLSFRSLAHEDDKNFGGSNGDLTNVTVPLTDHSRGEDRFHTPPIPAPMARKPNCTPPSTWGTSFWNKITSSPGPLGGDMPLSPEAMNRELSFPMHCRVLLKQIEQTFMVTVLLLRADRAMSPVSHGQEHEGVEVLAQSMVARNMTPGAVHVKLTSKVLVVDPLLAKEDVTETFLLKSEGSWRGSDVEKQFLLTTNKESKESLNGLLGTVVVEQAGEAPVFELHLVRDKPPTATAATSQKQDDHAWGAAGFRELASILHLVDENEDFEQLAKDLGFTEHELHTKLSPASDSFSALLCTYQSRGGTPQELVRAMYSCSRGRGLGVVGGSPSPLLLSSMGSQSSLSSLRTLSTPWGDEGGLSQDLEDLEEAAKLTTPCSSKRKRKNSSGHESCPMSVKRRCFSPLKPSLEEIENVDEELDLELCEAATLPVGDLELGIEQSHLPPTPPATPLKRLTDSRNNGQTTDTFLYQ